MLAFAISTPIAIRGSNAVAVTSKRARTMRRIPTQRSYSVFACAGQQKTEEPESVTVRYKDDGSRVVPISLFVMGTEDENVSGVYGVLDSDRELVYVGMSRNIAESILLHEDNHGDGVKYVKVMTFELTKAPEMKMIVDTWISENESMPIGNTENWEEADAELGREAALLEPVQQTGDIISPFEDSEVEVGEGQQAELLQLSEENIDIVLDEVRPFLISDGGNISVKSVDLETKSVELTLEGACGSCSSASMTMQMGVEKALRAKFGDNLGEVIAVSADDLSSSDITPASCEAVLDEVRAALRGLGGNVKVLEVDEGEVIMSFDGPNNLKYGIELMLKEKMPGVEAVTFQ